MAWSPGKVRGPGSAVTKSSSELGLKVSWLAGEFMRFAATAVAAPGQARDVIAVGTNGRIRTVEREIRRRVIGSQNRGTYEDQSLDTHTIKIAFAAVAGSCIYVREALQI